MRFVRFRVGVAGNALAGDGRCPSGIGVSVGHVWFLFVLFQLARDTRRRRNWVQKKRVVSDALIAKML